MFDSTIKFIYILTDFSACSIWQMSIEVSKYNSRLFFFQFHQSLTQLVWCPVVRWLHIKDYYSILETQSFMIFQCSSLFLIFFLVPKVAVSEINIATTPFFSLMFAWRNFLHLFLFHLCIFVFKGGFFCTTDSWGFFYSDNLLVHAIRPFSFTVIIDIIIFISIKSVTVFSSLLFFLPPALLIFCLFSFNWAFYI